MRSISLFLSLFLFISALHAEEEIPNGFVVQTLEPTFGKILRPEAWFYHSGFGNTSLLWTISKEDTRGGNAGYETGVRIQAFAGVKEGTAKSPEAFAKNFLEEKKRSASEIHKACDQENQGVFTRSCIEVTDGDYRILYSLFWANSLDIAVISIAGTKAADWDEHAETFKTMSKFEMVGMTPLTDDKKTDSGNAKPAADDKLDEGKKAQSQ
ncbi:MAG: hypothetical protein ACI9R3_000271 [Verrucomicrobiales bacterium]|jgi:hypothetical protein